MFDLLDRPPIFKVNELQNNYSENSHQWAEILVDCPGVSDVYTYRIPDELNLKRGDVVSIPFGNQILGGIVVKFTNKIPEGLSQDKIKEIADKITEGFFPSHYWELLEKTANYYCTPLMKVIRVALPNGLLGKSQRRIKLILDKLPNGYEVFCSPIAKQVIALLKTQPTADYTAKYIQGKIKNSQKAITELTKKGWIEIYLEPPSNTKVKREKIITLLNNNIAEKMTPQQQNLLRVLQQHGGELSQTELVNTYKVSPSSINTLQNNGYLSVQMREKLRFLKEKHPERDSKKQLTDSQQTALNQILTLQNHYAEILLHGVTGSGKTEVYLQSIEPILQQKKSALVLVPEIGLTPQLTDRFRARFGDKIYVYHSGLSEGEKYDTWRYLMQGEPLIVIGTRSAIFSPIPNLGMIILDEEHDPSFKQQDNSPNYHTRTVAQWRAQLENCPLIVGSATPSLETWVKLGQWCKPHPFHHYLPLPERIYARPLPPVIVVDMREELKARNRSIFSRSLHSALQEIQTRKEQAILFIHRRGHSTFVSCRSCGYVIECPHCDVSLSYHYTHEGATPLLRCHYCNYTRLHPDLCPQCDSPYLKQFGSGTQRVILELEKQFPELHCTRFDSDTTRTKGSHRQILSDFSQGKIDVLVGTQMLTKGLDIAQVTLVGIVSADGLLHQSDYRASERAFQTLTQVAGRAGRGETVGKVILQTYSPDHSVIQSVQFHNYHRFVETELLQRQTLNFPPYGRLISLKFSGLDNEEVSSTAEKVANWCQEKLQDRGEILGPAPATIMRIADRYRWQFLIKLEINDQETSINLNEILDQCSPKVYISLDVDPLSID